MHRRATTDRLAAKLLSRLAAATAAVLLAPTVAAAEPVDPQAEAQNYYFGVGSERRAAWNTPDMTAAVAQATSAYQRKRLALASSDPDRRPNPNACTTVYLCQIDPRLQDWAKHGGIVKPVLFTARSGATLSGHVWATRGGAARRPAVVFVNGSIIGFEEGWWYMAQSLARDGYVVLTFDAQGEGMSDQFGEAPDQLEATFAGTPGVGVLQGTSGGGSGLAFYDGGADALDFLLSTPEHPYTPVPSRTSHTSHAAKQRDRVATGLNPPFNPLWQLVDRDAIGITGHSYGAQAASWLAQQDPRLKAAVALDTLCVPVWPSPDEVASLAGEPGNRIGGVAPGGAPYTFAPECFAVPQGPAPRLRKPALGISADYLLSYSPYLAKPDPDNKLRASLTYSKAGVDSGEIIVRGGTHFDFGDDVSGFFPASLRGIDLGTWYTLAWFDKYLKHDPTADARLLSARWRDDPGTRAVDPAGDANLYSYYYRSRLDITLAGGARRDCEDLRAGCAGQPTASDDCAPAKFGFLTLATTTAPATTCTPCRAHATVDRRSLRVQRRTLTLAGRATTDCQPGATLSAPGVRRVSVAIARTTRGRCAFLTTRRRLTRPRSCNQPTLIRARGTSRWRLSTSALPPGAYRIHALATDQDGRREPPSDSPAAHVRIR